MAIVRYCILDSTSKQCTEVIYWDNTFTYYPPSSTIIAGDNTGEVGWVYAAGTATGGTWVAPSFGSEMAENPEPVTLSDGGTGAALTAANGGVVYSTSTTFAITAAGTAGQALLSAGSGAPYWGTLTLENLPDAWVKRSVKCATTANITLSAAQTIDGIAAAVGDRVLVKDQTTASQNGIYVVAAGAWTRSADADASSEIAAATVAVDQGTANGGKSFDTDFKSTDTLGTTAMSWSRVLDVATIGVDVQAYDADLGAIAALAGTTGLLRKTAANTWTLDTAAYLTSAVSTISFGTTGLTPSTATSGAVTVAGTLALANGGTGSTTKSGARGNLGITVGTTAPGSPAVGDLWVDTN